jgi:hypothetical protein
VSTKIHALVDALGNPLAFLLTPGKAHDLEGADALLPRMQAHTRRSISVSISAPQPQGATAYLDRRHHGLPWLVAALPQAFAGAAGQREHECQDSDNTHDLVSCNLHPRGASSTSKKPQAFSRCGQPGSKIYGYEMHPAPVNGAKTTLHPP